MPPWLKSACRAQGLQAPSLREHGRRAGIGRGIAGYALTRIADLAACFLDRVSMLHCSCGLGWCQTRNGGRLVDRATAPRRAVAGALVHRGTQSSSLLARHTRRIDPRPRASYLLSPGTSIARRRNCSGCRSILAAGPGDICRPAVVDGPPAPLISIHSASLHSSISCDDWCEPGETNISTGKFQSDDHHH